MQTELPKLFTEKMKALLGESYESFLQAFSENAEKSLRICEFKTNNIKFQAQAPFHVEPVLWVKNGFYFPHDAGASAHPWYRAGVYYITEASAMAPAEFLPVDPGDKVLDLCAAPGGKAFALAGKLFDTGLLVANEVNQTRAKALLYNMESIGCSEMIITNEQPRRLAEKLAGYFDKILVDAPCSGEGMFRKDPKAARDWSQSKSDQLCALQKSILTSAVKMLKTGGMLMYSTCTFSPEENEQNVSWLLSAFPEMQIEPLPFFPGFDHGRPEWAAGDERTAKAIRLWPHCVRGEGQFMALFRKTGIEKDSLGSPAHRRKRSGKNQQRSSLHMSKEEIRLLDSFCENLSFPLDKNRIESENGFAFYRPLEYPDLSGLRVLRAGLLLGEFKKNRFEPSQSLAFALSAETYSNCLNLSPGDERLAKYLRGETFPSENDTAISKDWILILCDGYPLGFGKVSGTLIKNKLLSSRRI